MEKEDIVNYVMNTPGNSNGEVLRGMLNQLNTSSGSQLPTPTASDAGKAVVCKLIINDGRAIASGTITTDSDDEYTVIPNADINIFAQSQYISGTIIDNFDEWVVSGEVINSDGETYAEIFGTPRADVNVHEHLGAIGISNGELMFMAEQFLQGVELSLTLNEGILQYSYSFENNYSVKRVTFSEDIVDNMSVYTCDTPFQKIQAALNSGMVVMANVGHNLTPLWINVPSRNYIKFTGALFYTSLDEMIVMDMTINADDTCQYEETVYKLTAKQS